MSTDKGYIRLYRDIRDHWIWKGKPYDKARAWIDLIMMVNHDDAKVPFDGSFEAVSRGSTLTSIRKLADRWGWSANKVRRFLDTLEMDGMLTQKRNSKRTIISVVNYSIHQDSRNTQRNTDGTLTEHQRNTDGNKQRITEGIIEEEKKNRAAAKPWKDSGIVPKDGLTDEEAEAGGWGFE